LFGVKRSITSGLVTSGWLEEHTTPTNKNSNVRGYPRKLLTLTASGREFLASNGVEADLKSVQPFAITEDQPLRHHAAVQFVTAKALQLGIITDFKVPRSSGSPSLEGEKEPDMILKENGRSHALEVEASRKENSKIRDFINKSCRLLHRKNEPLASVQIVTDDPYLHEIYYLTLFDYAGDIRRAHPKIQRSVEEIRAGLIFDDKDLSCIDLGLMPFY
jgi:hypothetical protein